MGRILISYVGQILLCMVVGFFLEEISLGGREVGSFLDALLGEAAMWKTIPACLTCTPEHRAPLCPPALPPRKTSFSSLDVPGTAGRNLGKDLVI